MPALIWQAPLALLCGWWSWWNVLLRPTEPIHHAMRANAWGLRDPAMRPHWERLAMPLKGDGGYGHRLINVFAEWNGLAYSQRGYKVASWLIVNLCFLGAALIALLLLW